jgi:glycerol-3-phosphate acyltransferase PlsY
MTVALCILTAYLLGSIPTSVWIGKVFYGIDIRKHGSRNAGATNTFRVLGKPAGSVVFIVDVAKGFLAVFLVQRNIELDEVWMQSAARVAAAIAAVMGHVFPVFAGFKGGKGVATAFGILLALTTVSAIACFVIFLTVWLLSNYVSLGSMIAALLYPVINFFLMPTQDDVLLAFTVILSITVILSHHRNIVRLIQGDETKTFAFRSSQKKRK